MLRWQTTGLWRAELAPVYGELVEHIQRKKDKEELKNVILIRSHSAIIIPPVKTMFIMAPPFSQSVTRAPIRTAIQIPFDAGASELKPGTNPLY